MQSGMIIKNGVPYGGIQLNDTQPISQIIQSDAESIPGYIKLTDERQSLLKSDYPELYDKIGDKYGNKDNLHFNTPSLVDVDEHYYDDEDYVNISSQLTFSNVSGDFTVRALRKGHVATLVLAGNYTGGKSTGTKDLIAGLPKKYLPYKIESVSGALSFPLTGYNSSDYVNVGRALFTSGGSIQVGESNANGQTAIRASVTYIV